MSKVVALYCVYNAQDLIHNSLTSVAPFVDEIRVYDGRYSEYRCHCGEDHDASCDATADEIEAWRRDYPGAPPLEYRVVAASSEVEKRNRMFRDMALGDAALVIDDDELITGPPEPVREFALLRPDKFAYVDFVFPQCGHGTGFTTPLARLFRVTPGLRYDTAYFRLVDDAGPVVDMKADNVGIPYGRRARPRLYLPPTTYMTSLSGFRSMRRSKAAIDYNNAVAARDWNRR